MKKIVFALLLLTMFAGTMVAQKHAKTTAKSKTVSVSADTKGYQHKMLVYENLKNSGVLKRFDMRFCQLDTLMKSTVLLTAPMQSNLITDIADLRIDSLYDAKTRYETQALHRHHGVEVTGQAYGRLDNALRLHDDEDDVQSMYKAKIQAELGWNIINSTLYQKRAKEQQIRLANNIDRLKTYRKDNTLIYDEVKNVLTQQYNYFIANVMTHRLRNIDLLNEAHQYMLEQDRITTDKMLEVMSDKMQIEYELAQISSEVDKASNTLFLLKPMEMVIDTMALYSDIDDDKVKKEILRNQEELIDTKSKLTNWWGTARFSPFARWSGYMGSTNKYSQNIDLGVRFTFPLWNETPRKRQAFQTEKEILRHTYEVEDSKLKSYCRLRMQHIAQLNSAIKIESSHAEQMSRYVTLRRGAYTQQESGYNYIARLEEYNEYFKSLERLYKLMLQRALTFVEMERQASLSNVLLSERIVTFK